ncbi:MAG: hypothetical protein RLY35_55 [Bacteroidota bacterium]|jgi:hypothetical protein
MERLQRNWWWIYSLVSGGAMVFYISAWMTAERMVNLVIGHLPMTIVSMAAVSSALFYLILRWPKDQRSSPYRFAALYGFVLSAGAYIVQSAQLRSTEQSLLLPTLMIASAAIVAFVYYPKAFLKRIQWSSRNIYFLKTFSVAWCWSVWATIPMMFIEVRFFWSAFIVSILLIAALVMITDINESRIKHSLRARWMGVFLLALLAEVMIQLGFSAKIGPGWMVLCVTIPFVVFWTKKKLLTALFVDLSLVFFYGMMSINAWLNLLP